MTPQQQTNPWAVVKTEPLPDQNPWAEVKTAPPPPTEKKGDGGLWDVLSRFFSEGYNQTIGAVVGGIPDAIKDSNTALTLTKMGLNAGVESISNLRKANKLWDEADNFPKGTTEHMNKRLEAYGHGMAALLPMIGPAALHVGEEGAKGNIAGMLGGGTGLIAATTLPYGKALKFADAAASTAGKMADRLSASKMTKVLSPPGGAEAPRFGSEASKIAPEIARDPQLSAWQQSTLREKVSTAADHINQVLDNFYERMDPKKMFPLAPVKKTLKDAIGKLTIEGQKDVPSGVRVDPKVSMKGVTWASPGAEEVPMTLGPNDKPLVQLSREVRPEGAADNPSGLTQPAGVGTRFDARGLTKAGREGLRDQMSIPQEDLPTPINMVGPEVTPSGAGIKSPIFMDKPNVPAQLSALRTALSQVEALGDRANAVNLRKLAQGWGKGADKFFTKVIADDMHRTAHNEGVGWASAERSLREYMSRPDVTPEVKGLNHQAHLYNTARRVLQATEDADRMRSHGLMRQSAFSAGGALAGEVVGSATGFPALGPIVGGVLGNILDRALLSDATTQIGTSRALARLADALKKNKPSLIEAELRSAAQTTGVKIPKTAFLSLMPRSKDY